MGSIRNVLVSTSPSKPTTTLLLCASSICFAAFFLRVLLLVFNRFFNLSYDTGTLLVIFILGEILPEFAMLVIHHTTTNYFYRYSRKTNKPCMNTLVRKDLSTIHEEPSFYNRIVSFSQKSSFNYHWDSPSVL